MSTAAATKPAASVLAGELIISADSHMMEPVDLWQRNLPPDLKERYPKFPPRNSPGEKPGGWDPKARLGEMAVDGVCAEVLYLYPIYGLRLFALEDAELQEACFTIANDFGQDTFMWSNDYPHAASTWPHSRDVIARELGHLPIEILRKVVRENVIKLYHLKIEGINA